MHTSRIQGHKIYFRSDTAGLSGTFEIVKAYDDDRGKKVVLALTTIPPSGGRLKMVIENVRHIKAVSDFLDMVVKELTQARTIASLTDKNTT